MMRLIITAAALTLLAAPALAQPVPEPNPRAPWRDVPDEVQLSNAHYMEIARMAASDDRCGVMAGCLDQFQEELDRDLAARVAEAAERARENGLY